MKNKILLSIVVLLLPIAVISFLKKETNFNLPKKEIKNQEKTQYSVKLKLKDDSIQELDLEDYVIGVVAGEMPASFHIDALKAQAIASRTYALYKKSLNQDYDLTVTTSDQVFLTKEEMQKQWKEEYEKYFSKITEAVNKTKGLVMKYNNEIIKAYYFARSNGYTEDAINVFNEAQDYLVSVESIEEDNTQTIELSKEDFCNKLSITCKKISISNIEKDASNRVEKITINNTDFSGIQIRKLLNLRSTDFIISVSDKITITTNGYGHGVGMSQYGANNMANKGLNYEEILKHYYKDIKIETI